MKLFNDILSATIKLVTITVIFVVVGIGFYQLVEQNVSPLQRIRGIPHIKDKETMENPPNGAIIRLEAHGKFFCSGFVVNASYVITAAHCLVDEVGMLRQDQLKVVNDEGTEEVRAKAAGLNQRLDYGIVTGDFASFKTLDLNPSESFFVPENRYGSFKACGFPMGQQKLFCTPFSPNKPLFFQVVGQGQAFPGMSGGPLIDTKTGAAVGVVSAMVENELVITPVIGIFGSFGIE